MASLPLGAVYLNDHYINHDPPTADELNRLRCGIKSILKQHGEMENFASGATIIGTAGTISTLAAIDLGLPAYNPDKINGHMLTVGAINRIVTLLSSSTLNNRRNIPGLEQGREDIIMTVAVVAQVIMEHFAATSMLVSD